MIAGWRTMSHVVLLGDSIFDNRAYTRGDPDVAAHLRSVLPPGWQVTLCAVDGATTSGLPAQVARLPPAASHLVVAIGGNDVLQHIDLLDLRVSSSGEALAAIADRLDRFEAAYRAALRPLLALDRPTILCTIYNGNLEPALARPARIALTPFNDAILRFAVGAALPVIDLRLVCCDAADYANPIEPSGPGGLKIAKSIARVLGAIAGPGPALVFAGAR